MVDLRLSITFFSFCFFCLAVVLISRHNGWLAGRLEFGPEQGEKRESELSYFTKMTYDLFENGQVTLHMTADKLNADNSTSDMWFQRPVGRVFRPGKAPVDFEGLRGELRNNKTYLHLIGKVHIVDDSSYLLSQTAEYWTDKEEVKAWGDVKTKNWGLKGGDIVFIDSERAFAWPQKGHVHYEGKVKGRIERPRPYEETIYFQCDDLYFYREKELIKMIGNVYIKKQNSRSYAKRGDIFLENYNKELKYFVLYDDVRVLETVITPGSAAFERKAFGEKLVGIMKEDKLILTGSPKVYQKGDVIKGNRITVRENNDVVEVDDSNSGFMIKD